MRSEGEVRSQGLSVMPHPIDASSGSAGTVEGGIAKTTLWRNGTKLGESNGPRAVFGVPADEGTYHAEMEHSRDTELPTKVTGAWNFKSKHTREFTHLPLTVVRYLPKLDDKDTAHGRVQLVPLKVEQAQNTPKVKRVTVEVSYDDGATWKQAQVAGDKLVLHQSKNAKFASLRTKYHRRGRQHRRDDDHPRLQDRRLTGRNRWTS